MVRSTEPITRGKLCFECKHCEGDPLNPCGYIQCWQGVKEGKPAKFITPKKVCVKFEAISK